MLETPRDKYQIDQIWLTKKMKRDGIFIPQIAKIVWQKT